ncbi:unnamed protein product [Penicillium olsonii]|nr:unnamed protein product [Penicillium olsonii]
MRILCLHGSGMSPDIMKAQMSTLRELCDPSWEFHFLAGRITCPPAPGVQHLPGPYLCYSADFDPVSVRAAQVLVQKEFETQGPFDGVLGFSAGAAILAGYLLNQRTRYPGKPLPVQFAVFCSAVPIVSTDPIYYQALYGSLSSEEEQMIRSGQLDQILKLREPIRTAAKTVATVTDTLKSILDNPPTHFLDRQPLEIPCPVHPDLYKARLNIPTLHIRGKKEPRSLKECALVLESFCSPSLRRTLEHRTPHSLPTSRAEVEDMLAAMEEVVGSDRRARL